MFVANPVEFGFWHFVTRLGELQLLLPVALWVCRDLMRQEASRSLAVHWLFLLAMAVLLTLASKIAFIGWGVGIAAWNFTGISGHAMFAAAVFPPLMATLSSRLSPGGRMMLLVLGVALAAMVAVSRIEVGAHSLSEVLAGLCVGGIVSAYLIFDANHTRVRLSLYVPVLVIAWLIIVPTQAPQLPTHSLVTQLALKLSGHSHAYTRSELLRHKPPAPGMPT
ncbi:hypothetical protein MIZ03_2483 [Rhodoferax lithotrophicus]|uniref:Phosphatidic acid phosphatase type 2/haloperoxidase domain-containing protein n=1 Tax=Rhodoferax lithotrophicus TaxID=2798804 RepID=A0ABM7MMW3_9BURK|nr:phosphatase PAP2 family protein [Rhodoferax sp. MIZ03]BCO27594.1 hypothetical protein MIZ03_2483 [Rhodoferax sp. MIZ03]